MTNKTGTITVEYFRLWDDHTWDTDFLDIPGRLEQVGTRGDEPIEVARLNHEAIDPGGDKDLTLDDAVRIVASKIKWRDAPPVLVGFYSLDEDQFFEDEEEEP